MPRIARLLLILCPLALAAVAHADPSTSLPFVAPGTPVVFESTNKNTQYFARSENGVVYPMRSIPVTTSPAGVTGGEIPQVPVGYYMVWAETDGVASPERRYHVMPTLTPGAAVYYAKPKVPFEIRVELLGPKTVIVGRDGKAAMRVEVPVTLEVEFGCLLPLKTTLVTKNGAALFSLNYNGCGDAQLRATTPGARSAWINVSETPPPADFAMLQPGDILLYRGATPILSDQIVDLESKQLGNLIHFDDVHGIPTATIGNEIKYSHIGIYVGDVRRDGTYSVAEMLQDGLVVRSVEQSVNGKNYFVDAWRRKNLTADQRNALVRAVQQFMVGKWPRYAFEALGILGAVGAGTGPKLLRADADLLSRTTDGDDAMICSELVARVFKNAGVPLAVQYWPALSSVFVGKDDRRLDYTTPNGIAVGGDLQFIKRFKPTR